MIPNIFRLAATYFAFITLAYATVITIDNEVIDEPTIKCEVDSIVAQFRTRRPFYGRLFVKGYSSNAQCVTDFATRSYESAQNNNVTIRVQYGTCDVRRDRSVSPRGVHMYSTVVLQFHTAFITKVDRSYRLSCFYKEAVQTVTNGLDVSVLTTGNLVETFAMPICSYSVRQETSNGPLIRYAKVGDRVVHRWECHSPGIEGKDNPYGMLVHSCIVDDGRGNKVSVVDERGCALDPYVLDHLAYSDDLLIAYRGAHVFKFADQNSLAFSCQIRLCMKAVDACVGMTPPKCQPLKNKRSVISDNKNWTVQEQESDGDVDVTTDRLLIFDTDELVDIPFLENDARATIDSALCLGFATALIFIGSTVFFLAILFISCSLFCIRSRRQIVSVQFVSSSVEEPPSQVHDSDRKSDINRSYQ